MGTGAVGVTCLLLTGGSVLGPREQKGGEEIQMSVLIQAVFHSFTRKEAGPYPPLCCAEISDSLSVRPGAPLYRLRNILQFTSALFAYCAQDSSEENQNHSLCQHLSPHACHLLSRR